MTTVVIETATDTWYMKQGATFRYGFRLYAVLVDGSGNAILDGEGKVQPDLTSPVSVGSCSARTQIREEKDSAAFKVSATSGAYDATNAPQAGRIFLDNGGVVGRIDIILTDEDTDKVNVESAVFDLEIQWPAQVGEIRPQVDRILEGPVVCDLNVTRES